MKYLVLLKNNNDFLLRVEAFFKEKQLDCIYIPEMDMSKDYDQNIIITPLKRSLLKKIKNPKDVIIFYPDKDDINQVIPSDIYWIKNNISNIECIYTKTKEWLDKAIYVELIIDDTKNNSSGILRKCIDSCLSINKFFSNITVLTKNSLIESYRNLDYDTDVCNIVHLDSNQKITTKTYFCLLDSRYKIDFECINKIIGLYKANKMQNKIFTNVADKKLMNGNIIKNYIGQGDFLIPVSYKGSIYPPIKNIVFTDSDTIENQLLKVFSNYRVIHSLDISPINSFKIED